MIITLKQHLATHETVKKLLQCADCNAKYATRAGLIYHQKVNHSTAYQEDGITEGGAAGKSDYTQAFKQFLR